MSHDESNGFHATRPDFGGFLFCSTEFLPFLHRLLLGFPGARTGRIFTDWPPFVPGGINLVWLIGFDGACL